MVGNVANEERFTSVRFHRYKAFTDYSLSLDHFNILVGPNNSGKSTILGAFRILAEAIRKARSRNPVLLRGPNGTTKGWVADLQNISVATENVFSDYDDSEPAFVKFRISNGNHLILFFPAPRTCYLICETQTRSITSSADFRTQFKVSIGFVPILGPVEQEEPLYLKEAARLALLSHGAARNFRNIWHHYPDNFEEFRSLIVSSWPGMDIERPEVQPAEAKAILRMFCPEARIPREIFWAGFGFQVWCQMLTHIVLGKKSSLFVVDEPDIYLHADLQRQLLGMLKTLGPDILMATHSTEIITEAEPDDLVIISKKFRSGKRIKDPGYLQHIFQALGSNLNPILTQLAKTRRALFVEGKDFQVISRFARKLNRIQVANQSDFAVIPVEGFNASKVHDFKQGMEATLGSKVHVGVIFDRDYRSDDECRKEETSLRRHCLLVHIHQRKELENFLLVPEPIRLAITKRLAERNRRVAPSQTFDESCTQLLLHLTDPLCNKIQAQYLAKRRPFEKAKARGLDDSTIDERLMNEFESLWKDPLERMRIVPGKAVLTDLNRYIQQKYRISISPFILIECFKPEEIPSEMASLIDEIETFRKLPID